MGLLVDLPPFSFGASMSLRSLPFGEGIGVDLPLQAALEAHWRILKPRRTRPGGPLRPSIFLSVYVAGEFEAVDSYYLLSGAGWASLK